MNPRLKACLRAAIPPALWELGTRIVRAPHGERAFAEADRRVRGDAYIDWLCRVSGGFLTPEHGNLRAFDYAVHHMPAGGAMIEIGSFLGMSTCILAYLKSRHHRDNPFFTCDPWIFEETGEPVGGFFDASTPAFRAYVMEVFRLNTSTFCAADRPRTVEATSDRFLALWARQETATDVFGQPVKLGGPIAFAYVDGSHTYESARSDFLGVHEHLMPGGYILFDDSAPAAGFGVARLMPEILARADYQPVMRHPNDLFRKLA